MFLKLGGCASDMTLCHILCTSEPGFGRGSFLLYIGMMCKWYDAVSYPLYTGTWVRTRVIFLSIGMMCEWYDAVSYPLYTGTWVRTRVIFTLYWDDVQVIWRCVISFVHRNLGSDEGHLYFILGWCASDMTLCHILCTPEPGFGRGSFLLYIWMMCKWYDAVSYPLYARTWVRTRVIFTLYWDDVQVIWRCVISFVRPYLGSDEGQSHLNNISWQPRFWCTSHMSVCHIPSTPGWPYECANIWPYNMTVVMGGKVSFQNPIGLHTGMAIRVCTGYVDLSYHLHLRISSFVNLILGQSKRFPIYLTYKY